MQNTDTKKASAFHRFFSNPVVGIAGSIASVIGLVLAIYFYVMSTTYRDLVFLVHPAKAVIVKAGQLSRLAVTLDGKTLSTDITAAQVAFWNEGNTAIRKEHVLQPFTLLTSPQARIIEATVRKKSREPVRIDLDTNRFDQGELGVSWNILEQGDGAILQIIFAGPPSTPISINAVIEGQRTLRKVESVASETPDDKKYGTRNTLVRNLALAYVAVAILMLGVGAMRFVRMRRRDIDFGLWRIVLYFGMPFLVAGMGLFMWFLLRQPEPPFGF